MTVGVAVGVSMEGSLKVVSEGIHSKVVARPSSLPSNRVPATSRQIKIVSGPRISAIARSRYTLSLAPQVSVPTVAKYQPERKGLTVTSEPVELSNEKVGDQ